MQQLNKLCTLGGYRNATAEQAVYAGRLSATPFRVAKKSNPVEAGGMRWHECGVIRFFQCKPIWRFGDVSHLPGR